MIRVIREEVNMGTFKIQRAIKDGRYYYWWRFMDGNNKIICNSETYWEKSSALHSIGLVQTLARDSKVEDDF